MIKTIPLDKLIASPRNVRRANDPKADAELNADIEARGLLQNLVVTSVRKPKGCFAVEAGERRRKALLALAAEGKLKTDHPVCCLIVDAGAGQEASLAENFQRLAMNPADECLAFSKLIEQGAEPDAIARRFGVTMRFVEGRLRLANLAPVVFEALGTGEISLDVAKAFAESARAIAGRGSLERKPMSRPAVGLSATSSPTPTRHACSTWRCSSGSRARRWKRLRRRRRPSTASRSSGRLSTAGSAILRPTGFGGCTSKGLP